MSYFQLGTQPHLENVAGIPDYSEISTVFKKPTGCSLWIV